MAYLNRLNAGILGDVLVLVETILGSLALPQAYAKLDEKDHDRLQGGDRGVTGPLRGDMVVEELERTEILVYGHQFLCALQVLLATVAGPVHGRECGAKPNLQHVLGLRVRRRRHVGDRLNSLPGDGRLSAGRCCWRGQRF